MQKSLHSSTPHCRAIASLALALAAAPAAAQPVLRSSTIDCGGHASAGGALRLTSVIGQHDAAGRLLSAGPTAWTGFLVPFACPADFNGDGVVNSQDFFLFLSDFFAGDADFDGNAITDSRDFFDFLNAFFAGCQ